MLTLVQWAGFQVISFEGAKRISGGRAHACGDHRRSIGAISPEAPSIGYPAVCIPYFAFAVLRCSSGRMYPVHQFDRGHG